MLSQHIQAWEAMLADQWLDAKHDPRKRVFKVEGLHSSLNIRSSADSARALEAARAARRGALPAIQIADQAPAGT